jgi:hypothetical protein
MNATHWWRTNQQVNINKVLKLPVKIIGMSGPLFPTTERQKKANSRQLDFAFFVATAGMVIFPHCFIVVASNVRGKTFPLVVA